MRFPLSLTTDMVGYMARKKLTRREALPAGADARAAARLQPDLHRLRPHPRILQTIKDKLTVEECLDSVDEAGAPIVSICGGEPMIYPEIGRLVQRHPQAPQAHLPLHQRHVHQEAAARVPARPAASSSTSTSTAWKRRTTWPWSAHGVFKAAVEGIMAAKKAGFLVCTNTTIFKETDLDEIDQLFAYLTQAGRGRLHAVAGLRLHGGAGDQPERGRRDLHDARRHPRQVQGGGEAARASTA